MNDKLLKWAAICVYIYGAICGLIVLFANTPQARNDGPALTFSIFMIGGALHFMYWVHKDSVLRRRRLLERLLEDERRASASTLERLQNGTDSWRNVPAWGSSNRPRLVEPRPEEGAR